MATKSICPSSPTAWVPTGTAITAAALGTALGAAGWQRGVTMIVGLGALATASCAKSFEAKVGWVNVLSAATGSVVLAIANEVNEATVIACAEQSPVKAAQRSAQNASIGVTGRGKLIAPGANSAAMQEAALFKGAPKAVLGAFVVAIKANVVWVRDAAVEAARVLAAAPVCQDVGEKSVVATGAEPQ